jgi:hypothetical protein
MKAWILLEITIFFCYNVTLIILLLKSRWTRIGVDQTHQFEPIFLSKLVSRIAFAVKFDYL